MRESHHERRGLRWLDQLAQDARFGIRQLLKNPGFTATAVATLALGIGVNTAIFSVINAVLLRPLRYPEPGRLMTLWERNDRRGIEAERVSGPDFIDWRAQSRSFAEIGFWNGPNDFNLVGSNGVVKIECAYAYSTLFPVLGVKPLLGRTLLPEEDLREGSRSAVITDEFWRRVFDRNTNILGRTLTLDTYGRRDYTIVGVMPPGFQFPTRCDACLAYGWMGVRLDERRSAHWYQVFGRLRAGATIEQARAELCAIQARIERENPGNIIGSEVAVVPLLDQTVGHKTRLALLVLGGVVLCVLLIACANVANLQLARAEARRREMALRLALGAGRWRVTRQLLTESGMLAVLGGCAGVWFAFGTLRLIAVFGTGDIPRLEETRLDGVSLVLALVASVTAGLLFGFAPAAQLLQPDLNDALKDGGGRTTGGVSGHKLRGLLVVSEIALSLALLIGASLMGRSFLRLAGADRGFQPGHLITADLDFSVSGFTSWVEPTSTRPQVTLREIMEMVRRQPGVQWVAAASKLPLDSGGARTGAVAIENHPPSVPGEFPTADCQGVSPDYFHAMGIPMLGGRLFTENDVYGAFGVVIINQAMARRYFPNENPVGRRLALGDVRNGGQPASPNPGTASSWSEIVGVAGNLKSLGPNPEAAPTVYFPYWQWPMQSPTLLARSTSDPAVVAAAIRSGVKAANKNLPEPVIRTMDQILSDSAARPRFQAVLMGLFGVVALLLASVGAYGVMSCFVAQRTHEIGVRLALGARRGNVLSFVIGQGMRLALAGVGIGLALALGLSRMMAGLLFVVDPTDPLTFGATSSVLLVAAFLACWAPAWRAASVDPVVALRSE